MKLAIIGSEDEYWTPAQRTDAVKKIYEILTDKPHQWGLLNTTFISGGCPRGGIDIWAEILADALGFKKQIYYPEVNQWEDMIEYDDYGMSSPNHLRGYKSRNLQIAKVCDVLYCIEPKGRKWSGGIWTMSEVEKLGKSAYLVEIE